MERLLQTIYRLGLASIWLAALFCFVFGCFAFFQGVNGKYEESALILVIGAPIVAVVVHLIWRWVLGEKMRTFDKTI